jgi:hypothetical protein
MKKGSLKSFQFDVQTEYVVAFLLAVIIILPVDLPDHLAELVNNILGKVILIGICVSLFFYHPVVGTLALVAVYQLLRRINKEQEEGFSFLDEEVDDGEIKYAHDKKVKYTPFVAKPKVKDERSLEEQHASQANNSYASNWCGNNCGTDTPSGTAKQGLSTKGNFSIL